jgi:hypothetical protein
MAEDYTLIPQIKLWTGYNDNILFERQDEQGDFAGILTGILEFSTIAERYNIKGRAAGDIVRYFNKSEFDEENFFLDLKGNYRISARWSTEAFFGFIKDTTLDSFLEDTGRVTRRSDVHRYRARLGAAYQLTEVSNLDFNYNFRRNNFKDRGRVDTNANIFRLRYSKDLKTQRDTFITQASYGFTRSSTVDSDTGALEVGWNHDFTNRLRFTSLVGGRYTQQRLTDGDDTDRWGALADLRLTYQTGQLETANIGFRNDLRPNTNGELLIVYRLFADYSRRITERLTGVISGRISYSDLDDRDADDIDVIFWEIRPILTYAFTPRHSLELGYWFQQSIDRNRSEDESVDRNRIWLAFTFNFQNLLDLWN